MKIYISIPISGLDVQKQANYAARIANELISKGHEVENPFSVPAAPSHLIDEKEIYAYYMGEDIKLLLTCDAIFLCDGWEKSRGCNIERKVAFQMGMKAYKSMDEL